jgi:hypothetical protein
MEIGELAVRYITVEEWYRVQVYQNPRVRVNYLLWYPKDGCTAAEVVDFLHVMPNVIPLNQWVPGRPLQYGNTLSLGTVRKLIASDKPILAQVKLAAFRDRLGEVKEPPEELPKAPAIPKEHLWFGGTLRSYLLPWGLYLAFTIGVTFGHHWMGIYYAVLVILTFFFFEYQEEILTLPQHCPPWRWQSKDEELSLNA